MSMKKIVLFAGTTEGHRLCEYFVQNKWQAEVFVATEYGREILPQAPNLHIHAVLAINYPLIIKIFPPRPRLRIIQKRKCGTAIYDIWEV